MTEEEALRMRAELEKHYGYRVAPVNEYCEALQTFLKHARGYITGGADEWGGTRGGYLTEQNLHNLEYYVIGKSSFLDRLLYGGEKLRTVPCPVHKGHWSGLPFEPPPCGCDLTGWLRAE